MRPNKIYHDESWLYDQYWNHKLSTYQIAKLVKCTARTISYRMKKFNIPRRNKAESNIVAWSNNHSKARRERMSDEMKEGWRMGRYSSPESQKKLSNSIKRNWKEGKYSGHSEMMRNLWESGTFDEMPEKIREAWQAGCYDNMITEEWLQNRSGEKASNWHGGISYLPYPPEFDRNFKMQIMARDANICAICKLSGNCIHHIDYDKNNTIPENCIVLCRSCHSVTNFNRNYWQPALSQIIQARASFGAVA